MGQHRYVGEHDEVELLHGNPRPAVVKRDEVFTVDDDVDETYHVEGIYEPVSTSTAPPAFSSPASSVTSTPED